MSVRGFVALELGAERDTIHPGFAGQHGGASIKASQQMPEDQRFDVVVQFPVGALLCELRMEPDSEGGVEFAGGGHVL